MRRLLVVALLVMVCAAYVRADETIWIEGETPTNSSFNRHSWYGSQDVNRELLSGGNWLAHYHERVPAVATYTFNVEEGGDYTWWLRCNPFQIEHSYSVDRGPWKELPTTDVRERTNLLTKGIDMRFIAWVKAGEMKLKPGKHSIRLKVEAGERESHAGIDCMALVNYPWAPSGTARPEGAPAPEAGEGGSEGEYVWIEGERANRSNFNRHDWYSSTDVDTSLLSGGAWLAHYDKNQPALAEYHFRIEEGGTYDLWIRCNPFQVKHRFLIDRGNPRDLKLTDVRENVNLLTKGIDIRKIAWVKAGEFELSPGRHRVVIRVEKGQREAHGGIDCICLVNFSWAPTGTARPEIKEKEEGGPGEWFPIYPDDDEFSEESITDMRSVISEHTGVPAGRFGFVQSDGEDFVLSERPGKPVKFWGLCAGPAKTPELQRQQAKYYAKHGLNMLRKHTVQAEIGLLEKGPGGERRFDPERLDRFDRWFSILKENGIYMTWSCFYPHRITREDDYPPRLYAELPDRGKGKSTSGFVNFMPRLQDAEWEWLKALLLHKNPYTGLRYVNDPALAVIEVHNEDCIFFHSPLNDLAADAKFPRHSAILKRRWMEWLKDRYGTDSALREAWGAGMRPGDSVDNPDMDIYGAWQLSAEGPDYGDPVGLVPEERQRMGDFIRFLTELQRSCYAKRQRRLKQLGFNGSTVSTAWRAGGAAAEPANIWCDMAMDVIDRHNYFGGGAGGHGIAEGEVRNDTHMDEVGSHLLSIGFYQAEHMPFIVTEWTQKPPNQWKAEAAPLFAFYGMGLQGWDGSYHFAGGRPRMGSGWPNMRAYVTETPHFIGQFPALAFALYRGHVSPAPTAAARRLELEDIFQGIDALNQDFTGGGYDQKELVGNLRTPKEVLGIGRVTVDIGEDVERPERADWDTHWDRTDKTVESMTDELHWDYGERVVTVRTPRTQGIIGFAGGSTYELPGAEVSVRTPFVSLLFTPLDDRPLAESEHVLITAMARDKQTGARYNEDGTRLLEAGRPPLLLEPVQADITLKGPDVSSVRTVDIYGVPTDREVEREGNSFTIDGRYQTYYYEVKR